MWSDALFATPQKKKKKKKQTKKKQKQKKTIRTLCALYA